MVPVHRKYVISASKYYSKIDVCVCVRAPVRVDMGSEYGNVCSFAVNGHECP